MRIKSSFNEKMCAILIIPKWIKDIPRDQTILITGPTASGKSSLATAIAEKAGGRIINADALQVFKNWRILTARPTAEEERRLSHSLYGHIEGHASYSVGHWLREVIPILKSQLRPIIVGGTGLYFTALTKGLAAIPEIPLDIKSDSEKKLKKWGLNSLIRDLDVHTKNRIDLQNPRRVLRAWQVWSHTGRSILDWQKDTPSPTLSLGACKPILLSVENDRLNHRIEQRFKKMIELGVLDEARENAQKWCPDTPSLKAIGAHELISHARGDLSSLETFEQVSIATKKLAKRQRTWFRSNMKEWINFEP